ncbi:phage baseplate protein [Alistipes sp.]|uniref:phage baseplate protein n=1 Tax=Alistipes sp. TaxID=1872444 RepID=UPI003AB539A6
MRGRFIVGYNTNDADYNKYGKVGGQKKHALTVSEMPAHAHGYSAPLISGEHPAGSSGYRRPNGVSSGTTDAVGGGQAHETRPPFYTLAYIMRVK